jgi:hypothetical protein
MWCDRRGNCKNIAGKIWYEYTETDKSGKLNGNYYQNDHGNKYKKNGLTTSGNVKALGNLNLWAVHKYGMELSQSTKCTWPYKAYSVAHITLQMLVAVFFSITNMTGISPQILYYSNAKSPEHREDNVLRSCCCHWWSHTLFTGSK